MSTLIDVTFTWTKYKIFAGNENQLQVNSSNHVSCNVVSFPFNVNVIRIYVFIVGELTFIASTWIIGKHIEILSFTFFDTSIFLMYPTLPNLYHRAFLFEIFMGINIWTATFVLFVYNLKQTNVQKGLRYNEKLICFWGDFGLFLFEAIEIKENIFSLNLNLLIFLIIIGN